MPFPSHIGEVLDRFGVIAETKAALYDLYLSLGDEVLDVFADLAEHVEPSSLTPADTLAIRWRVIERYLSRNHPQWLAGKPTASLYHPRVTEGRASGLALPLGELPRISAEPVPDGILMLGRNAHFGGRMETISFDVVARELADAIAIGQAIGQQHTLPGSVGETSGTIDNINAVALLWEIQPNVYKPAGERNRGIARLYRRHRNWHLLTLTAALQWLREQRCTVYILRGEALAPTHEVNPEKPVSPAIVEHHNRTVAQVVQNLGESLGDVTDDDEFALLQSEVMNHALRKHVLQHGAAGATWKLPRSS